MFEIPSFHLIDFKNHSIGVLYALRLLLFGKTINGFQMLQRLHCPYKQPRQTFDD